MGQQPNVELTAAQKPRPTPEPEAARRWRPTRPGVITSPDQVPTGGSFGTPGPDTGYALVIVRAHGAELSEAEQKVVVALMAARSSKLGRAPTKADLEVAKLLAGLGDGLPQNFVERGQRWVAAAEHERVPGRLAVNEAEPELLVLPAADARRSIRIVGGWAMTKGGSVPDHENRPV
jgi:hypothetical protein